MSEPSANSDHPDSSAQRRRQQGRVVGGGIMAGTAAVVAWLTISPFTSLLSRYASPQRQLAYGGAAYALTFVAAALLGVLHRVPEGLLKLTLLSLIFGITIGPTWVGSYCIALAFVQLAGWHVGAHGIVLIGILLWAVVVFGIALPFAVAVTRRARVPR